MVLYYYGECVYRFIDRLSKIDHRVPSENVAKFFFFFLFSM